MKHKKYLRNRTVAWAAVLFFCFTDCKTKQTNTTEVSYTGECAIVYKTKTDYRNNVPVTMNADKTAIVSYPAPTDVYYKGKLAYPTALLNGYWLDNRGISVNTVFLKLTYEEYSKLDTAPTLEEMTEMIVDKNPFTEIYNLGNRSRFTNETEEINTLIKKGALKKFKRLL
jgi:hypothetical protein